MKVQKQNLLRSAPLLVSTLFYPVQAVAQDLINPGATLGQNLETLYPRLAVIVFPLAFLVLIYAGYLFLTSAGNQNQVNEAKQWLIAAVTGVLLYILIPAILSFIGTQNTGMGTSPTTTPNTSPNDTPVTVPQFQVPS